MTTKAETVWIQTHSGERFHLFDPREYEVCLDDIAHSLAMKCRFGGFSRMFYSVAEHSIRVADYLKDNGYSKELQLLGLMHDAAEAFLPDFIGPAKEFWFVDLTDSTGQKKLVPAKDLELLIQCVLFKKFKIRLPTTRESIIVHRADKKLLATEKRDVLAESLVWDEELPPPLSRVIQPMELGRSKRLFLEKFKELTKGENE